MIEGNRALAGVEVSHGDGARRFTTAEIPEIEDAVGDALASTPAEVVRFGDTVAWRRTLPAAAVDAVRRRVAAATTRAGATLLAWTAESPRAVDRLDYDVVLG